MSEPAETLPDPVAAQVAAGFRLGRVISCRRVIQGLMNPNWRLATSSGNYAIKQLRDRPPATVRDNHRVLPTLAERGLPVPLPCTTRDGATLLNIGDDFYTATAWLPGIHLDGHDLTLDACAALGELTGRLHDGLAQALPEPPASLYDRPADVDDTHARLEHFSHVAARRPGDAFDEFALAEIRRRHALLEQIADQRPPETPVEPVGWTHGDLQPLNILLDAAGQVTAILDWDRLDVRSPGAEVVRTATIWFTDTSTGALDLHRVAAFVRGYRLQQYAITDEQLLDAARRRWWHLATGTWQLRLHYDQNDRGCDHLFRSDARLLRWWRNHAQAVDLALTESSPSR